MVTTPKPRPYTDENYNLDPDLTPKQKKFAEEYALHFNATRAYINAGYTVKNDNVAAASAVVLLRKSKIKYYIRALGLAEFEAANITKERVVLEYAKMGFADMSEFADWDNDGIRITPSKDLTKRQTGAVADISVDEHSVRGREGDTITYRKVKFKLANKQAALDSLAKHLGMFIERTEITGPDGGPIQVSIAESFGVVVEGSVVSDSKELPEG